MKCFDALDSVITWVDYIYLEQTKLIKHTLHAPIVVLSKRYLRAQML